MKYYFLSLIIFFSAQAFPFDWNNCEKAWIVDSSWAGEGAIISTFSYISSTGECALIGQADHDAKVFIDGQWSNIHSE